MGQPSKSETEEQSEERVMEGAALRSYLLEASIRARADPKSVAPKGSGDGFAVTLKRLSRHSLAL